MTKKKLLTIVTPCYNEEKNVENIYSEIKKVFSSLPDYNYEHLFIDNASTDNTVFLLKRTAEQDKRVKVIVNTRNFGHIRSPFHGLLQARGDAVIFIVADLQDPPSLIKDFIIKWEEGYKIVIGVKKESEENKIMFLIRTLYYKALKKFSEIDQVQNFMGFGLYDRVILDELRKLKEPYPYFRGLITEIGFERYEVNYNQAIRKKGKTKNNFYTLYDMAMLGFVNHSKLPLRLASFIGLSTSVLSFFIAFFYFIFKLIYWQEFQLGIAPAVIGMFFFGSVQLFFIGVIGEYIGAIYTQVKNRPLVVEKERINFNGK
jgi:polyisoprenyl-phosphate glycosyltransferase